MNWQMVTGACAALMLIGTLFAVANKWIIGRITTAIGVTLAAFEKELFAKLEQKYVTRESFATEIDHAKETHERHDDEVKELWRQVNQMKASKP